MDLQDGSGSETSEQSLQKLQSETDILAVTGVSCLLFYSWTMEYEAEYDISLGYYDIIEAPQRLVPSPPCSVFADSFDLQRD